MSTEYAPDALRALFDQLAAELPLELSGIVGDQAHAYGYHRARAVLPPSDYSVQLADDQAGDSWAASALDVKPTDGTPGMARITRRLIDATAHRDPRLRALREFYGTLDGVNVTGRDVTTGATVDSDPSHLWHVHLSVLRRYANDHRALAELADVILGHPAQATPAPSTTQPTPLEDDPMARIITITKHPTTGKERGWVTGPGGITEVAPAEAGRAATLLGLEPVRCSEANLSGPVRKAINDTAAKATPAPAPSA